MTAAALANDVATKWRARADQLDEYARCLRRSGDTREAAHAEQCAVDFRIEADALEAAGSVAAYRDQRALAQ